MPSPQRVDRYGRPLPELTPASTAPTFDATTNKDAQSYLHALVEDACRIVCRRGWHGEVRLGFSVHDGFILRDMRVGVERIRQAPQTEPNHGHP